MYIVAWHTFCWPLLQALREIDELLKYLDKAENEINMADAVSTDPETLAVQLRDHKIFHHDLEQKRRSAVDYLNIQTQRESVEFIVLDENVQLSSRCKIDVIAVR